MEEKLWAIFRLSTPLLRQPYNLTARSLLSEDRTKPRWLFLGTTRMGPSMPLSVPTAEPYLTTSVRPAQSLCSLTEKLLWPVIMAVEGRTPIFWWPALTMTEASMSRSIQLANKQLTSGASMATSELASPYSPMEKSSSLGSPTQLVI